MKSEIELKSPENYKGFTWDPGYRERRGQPGGWDIRWEKGDSTYTDHVPGVVLYELGKSFDEYWALRINLAKGEVFQRLEANFEYDKAKRDVEICDKMWAGRLKLAMRKDVLKAAMLSREANEYVKKPL